MMRFALHSKIESEIPRMHTTKMSGLCVTCVYLWMFSLVQMTEGDAFISIRFVTFHNPRGLGSNVHCCDGKWGICPGACDHSFEICLDQMDGTVGNYKKCAYASANSGEISNVNAITFGNKIGRLANPIVWRLGFWPGSVLLKINVVDVDDSNNDDHVAYLYRQLSIQPLANPEETNFWLTNRVSLNIAVRVYCGRNFYGLNCSVYCVPNDDRNGHYTCDQRTGAKICNLGWVGSSCSINKDDCVGEVCQNGGTCHDLLNDFTCTCPPGYQGRYCQADINECLVYGRCRYGDCVNLPGTFKCSCHLGYEGPKCDINIDDCAYNPCRNGATCTDGIGNYTCQCAVGYIGQDCADDLNECSFHPCENNATCLNFVGSYKCDCLPGYSGSDCSQDVNECLRVPCQNGGQCSNLLGGYKCQCPGGFEGLHCETDIDECALSNTTCLNEGTCNNTVGGYVCQCLEGYSGRWCQTDVDECLDEPCMNGATCLNVPGNFNCVCRRGFTGKYCKDDINECDSGVCQNGGSCLNLPGGYHCTCTDFWEGLNCQTNVNECLTNPCKNGHCQDEIDGYRCVCPSGFIGRHCETDVNECEVEGEYCLNNATCVNTVGSYRCVCEEGWGNENCGEDIDECVTLKCNNWGRCTNTPGGFTCDCMINWTGRRCEEDVDECVGDKQICRNGATCVNLYGTFNCVCPPGWTGVQCDEDIDECLINPDICSFRGNSTGSVSLNNMTSDSHVVCLNTAASYTCVCDEGWTGNLCDVDIDECVEGLTTTDPYGENSDGFLNENSTDHNITFSPDLATTDTEKENISYVGTSTERYTRGNSGENNENKTNKEVSIPFYLDCNITNTVNWTVSKGLEKLFKDSMLYNGTIEASYKSQMETSKDGKTITAIYPDIQVSGEELEEHEVSYILNRFKSKLEHYMYCPLFLDAVAEKVHFVEPPLNYSIENWYPALIAACGLLAIGLVAMIIVKNCKSNRDGSVKYDANLKQPMSYRNELYLEDTSTQGQPNDETSSGDFFHPSDQSTSFVTFSSKYPFMTDPDTQPIFPPEI